MDSKAVSHKYAMLCHVKENMENEIYFIVKNLSAKKKKEYITPECTSERKTSVWIEKWSEVTQSCPTLCDPVDCSLLGSSARGIFEARMLEWVAISFSRGSSLHRDRTQVSCIVGRCFTVWATYPTSEIGVAAKRSYPTSKEWQLHRRRRPERSYSTFKVRRGSRHMTHQSHCWAYTPGKPELKETQVSQCSSQHCS